MPDQERLQDIADRVRACTLCPLAGTRTRAVPGEGSGSLPITLVGEAPGRNEDESGRPFCGAAGKNLELALDAAKLRREDLFVTSIVKCRPPKNRDPKPAECEACRPYLLEQVQTLQPRVLVALGRYGLRGLVPDAPEGFTRIAGSFQGELYGVPVWVSLHPAAVIYRQKWKAKYLDDWTRFGAWYRSGAPVDAFARGPPLDG